MVQDKDRLFESLVIQICSGTLCSVPNFYNRDLWVGFYDKRPKMKEAEFARLSKKMKTDKGMDEFVALARAKKAQKAAEAKREAGNGEM